MAIDLHGAGGREYTGNRSWRYLLELAHDNGWEPSGTGAPPQYRDARDEEKWDAMDYFSPAHQLVGNEDAARMAAALQRALSVIPEGKTVAAMAGDGLSGIDEHLTPIDWFSGDGGRERVREFAEFFKAGGFVIL